MLNQCLHQFSQFVQREALLLVTFIYLLYHTLHVEKALVNNFFQLFLWSRVSTVYLYSVFTQVSLRIERIFLTLSIWPTAR